MNKYLIAALAAAVLALGWTADHYHDKAVKWRSDYRTAYGVTQQQSETINTMGQRQQALANLDKKHTQELVDANNQIDALQHAVDAGLKRLRLNARCPSVPAGKTSGAAGVADGASARLTDSAERDYYTLRKRIETARKQIDGLQDYIWQECLP